MDKLFKSVPLYVVLAAMLVLLAGSAFISRIPVHVHTTQPPIGVFLIMGLFVIALTAAILAAAVKFGLPLKQTTVKLVFGFNVLIVVVKFVAAPLSLYISNTSSMGFVAGSPLVSAGNYWWIAVATFMLYGLVLYAIFKMAYRRYSHKEPKHISSRQFLGGLILLALALYMGGSLVGLLLVPVAPVVLYLTSTGPGLPVILILLIAAMMIAAKAFRAAADEARQLRNATLLASLFWLCLSIILLYHILWVVFMTALITIWPFKTFIPNSK